MIVIVTGKLCKGLWCVTETKMSLYLTPNFFSCPDLKWFCNPLPRDEEGTMESKFLYY